MSIILSDISSIYSVRAPITITAVPLEENFVKYFRTIATPFISHNPNGSSNTITLGLKIYQRAKVSSINSLIFNYFIPNPF